MKNARMFLIMVMALGLAVQAHASIFTDETSFTKSLAGLSTSSDDFSSYSQGNIANSQSLGAFTYSYDPSSTQPGIASDGNGGKALGDTYYGTDPNTGTGVFVGGEAVNLTYNGAKPLIAFGADFSYAPNFEPLPGNLYKLVILDGKGGGTILGNLTGLDANGGTFFLGFIGAPGFDFTKVSLQSSATDANGNPYFTPAYQVNKLIYGSAAPVPVPNTLILLLPGVIALIPFMVR